MISSIPIHTKMASNKATNVPKSADFDQVMNKLNLTMAKHSSVLNSLRRTSRPATSSKGGSATNNTTTAATTKPKSSFSSLANKAPSAAAAGQKPRGQQHSRNQNPRGGGDEEDDDFKLPENVGVGYVPAAREAAESAGTRDLRGRLLGKRAMEQKEEAKKKRTRAAMGESSDEEEGRSAAVGKGKKRRGKGA
ncbi:hypothetical protein VSDG_01139 [Cytospora chrysosperma]|uniref:Uncharacterized protein n=1 Tax=Cytospora chrysosperma TaxID=252740 RepID=A0A423WLL8_CYTCH|nr:hypothetical protein VSDG_01139 [Valsa sordida]